MAYYTARIHLHPFNLKETELFLQSKGGKYDRHQILQLYMALGGIPFYWEQIMSHQSIAQNIDELFFSESGLLKTEFANLYRSLFNAHERHVAIIRLLAEKSKGLPRAVIAQIERRDRVINLCEIKFSEKEYTITKAYAENLKKKVMVFREETKTNRSIFLTFITLYGLKKNQYSINLVQTE